MQNKYFNGKVANPHADEPLDDELKAFVAKTVTDVEAKMNDLRVADALEDIIQLFGRLNKYIDETMPWALAKDPEKTPRLATVLYNLLESIRTGAVLLSAYLPETAEKILNQLNTQQRDYDSIQTFGLLETNIAVTDTPEILFARLNEKEVMEKIAVIQDRITEAAKKAAARKAEITMDDFSRMDLKVGKVVACEKHPDADKLLIMKVDCGEGKPRQIVSGLAGSYTPGQMIGKSIVVVTNLKPAELRGYVSQGMLLAGKENETYAVVEVNGLKPGTKIR